MNHYDVIVIARRTAAETDGFFTSLALAFNKSDFQFR